MGSFPGEPTFSFLSMGAQRTRLLELAASVADGSADIDWKRLEASVEDDDDRQLLQDLRVLAGVADLVGA